MIDLNNDDEIEYVEAELVDVVPPTPTPTVKMVSPEELPNNPVRAPEPGGLFQSIRCGPPRKFANPEQMKEAIDRYFSSCIRAVERTDGEVEYFWVDAPTVPGLSRALGFKTSTSLLNYQKLDEFEPIITEAKLVIEEYSAKALIANPKATGLIFILKNMGWQDNRTVTYAPPTRLEAAKTPEQLAELIEQDIVD